MSSKVLQPLLASGEYDEIEDVVVVEGEFVELDSGHVARRQVILGITPCDLIVSHRRVLNYKEHPEVYYDTEFDPLMENLEVVTVWPLYYVRFTFTAQKHEIMVDFSTKIRYFLLTNTSFNENLDHTWAMWQERIQYLMKDPYGYVNVLHDEVVVQNIYKGDGSKSDDVACTNTFLKNKDKPNIKKSDQNKNLNKREEKKNSKPHKNNTDERIGKKTDSEGKKDKKKDEQDSQADFEQGNKRTKNCLCW